MSEETIIKRLAKFEAAISDLRKQACAIGVDLSNENEGRSDVSFETAAEVGAAHSSVVDAIAGLANSTAVFHRVLQPLSRTRAGK